jgi:hypothetical protein
VWASEPNNERLMALQTAFLDFKTRLNQILAEGDYVMVLTNAFITIIVSLVFDSPVCLMGKVLSFQTTNLCTMAMILTIV